MALVSVIFLDSFSFTHVFMHSFTRNGVPIRELSKGSSLLGVKYNSFCRREGYVNVSMSVSPACICHIRIVP